MFVTFDTCSSLKSISFSEGQTSVGYEAFYGCSRLTSVSLPASLTSIRNNVFGGCSSLASIKVDEANPHYSSDGVALFNKTKSEIVAAPGAITNYVVPSSVTYIWKKAFYDCNKLTSVSLPEGLNSIGKEAFYNCNRLASISLPESLNSIGEETFYNCSSLASVFLPEGLTYIGEETFYGCSKMASVSLPKGLTSIGNKAFKGCGELKSIYAYMPLPVSINNNIFEENVKKDATLYVPQGSFVTYWISPIWEEFEHIEEFDPTGVETVTATPNATEVERHSLNGQRLAAPTKGVNIVKYSDGTVKKVAVK